MWKLHRYKEADNYDLIKWLEKELELTDKQKQKLFLNQFPRFSGFTFLVNRTRCKPNLFWRLTSIPYVVFNIMLYIGLPFTYLFTGEMGYSIKFYDNYVSKWRNKIGF